MDRYWLINCPTCQQGRLFVEVQVKTGDLMLECEECSRAWGHPDQVSPTENAFPAIDIISRFANEEEIKNNGWSKWKFQKVTD
jgi:hypothetical protein